MQCLCKTADVVTLTAREKSQEEMPGSFLPNNQEVENKSILPYIKKTT